MALVLALPGARAATAAIRHQRSFASPEEAAQALAAAVKANDTKAVLAVLGSGAQPLISSGDPVADQKVRDHFVQSYDEAHSLVPGDDGETVLQIGKDDWPFPIPLVKSDAGWRFDAAAGKEEILDRRIGAQRALGHPGLPGVRRRAARVLRAQPGARLRCCTTRRSSPARRASVTASTGTPSPTRRRARSARCSPAPGRRDTRAPARAIRITATTFASSPRRALPPPAAPTTTSRTAR